MAFLLHINFNVHAPFEWLLKTLPIRNTVIFLVLVAIDICETSCELIRSISYKTV